MLVRRRPSFGFEPSVFELRLKSPDRFDCARVQEFAAGWYAVKADRVSCPCFQTLVLCLPQASADARQLLCEWMCEVCVPEFLRYLEQTFGDDLVEVTLGLPDQ